MRLPNKKRRDRTFSYTTDDLAVLTKFFNETHTVTLSVDNCAPKGLPVLHLRATFAQLLNEEATGTVYMKNKIPARSTVRIAFCFC